jgi:hypothetical protein
VKYYLGYANIRKGCRPTAVVGMTVFLLLAAGSLAGFAFCAWMWLCDRTETWAKDALLTEQCGCLWTIAMAIIFVFAAIRCWSRGKCEKR